VFPDCPAYLNHKGDVRCGLPSEVERRFTMGSSGGHAESAMIRCPAGHWFNGPIQTLTGESRDNHDPGRAGVASRAGRGSPAGSQDRPAGSGGSGVREFPAEAGRDISRPNGAPAYYQGRAARLWITAMRPRRSRPAPGPVTQAAAGGQQRIRSGHRLLAGAGSKLPA
jgi:hypothetical protein